MTSLEEDLQTVRDTLECPNQDAPMHTESGCNWCAGTAPARAAFKRVLVAIAGRSDERLHQLRELATREPIHVDISDYSDEFCLGFLAGQANALDAVLMRDRETK